MNKSRLFSLSMISFVALGLLFSQCSKDKDLNSQDVLLLTKTQVPFEQDPDQDPADIPPATVQLKAYESAPFFKDGGSGSYLSPENLSATLAAEESIGETKTGYIDGAPPKGDVMFCFDLTGSMFNVLSNANVNSVNIMNAVQSVIPDTYFGTLSHKDYSGVFEGCGYINSYGGPSDFPYNLDQPLTSSISTVSTTIGELSTGGGSDLPESYSRALYESYSDPSILWRPGSKRIVVAWLDNVPHDCAYNAVLSGSTSTGLDPGRDAVAGNADDLAILDVLQGMNDNNITLIVLCSGNSSILALWQEYAELTGGTAVAVSSTGVFPVGSSIETTISDLISNEVSSIDELSLEVCTSGFESWLTSITPSSFTSVSLDSPWTDDFDIMLTVPAGTVDGLYEFDICMIGDGVEYGRQHVSITVENTIEVPFDVRPDGCPNPFNRNSKGVLPTAILGFEGFDVSEIDPSTVNISGVYAQNPSVSDQATPAYPFLGKDLSDLSCNSDGPDGYPDLQLKFSSSDIAALLAGASKGDYVRLEVTGELYDGRAIAGEDIVLVVK